MAERFRQLVVFEPSYDPARSVRVAVNVSYEDGIPGQGIYWVPVDLSGTKQRHRQREAVRIAHAVAAGIARQVALEE